MKKRWTLTIAAIAAAAAAAAASGPADATDFITIGGGPTGGAYYAISTGLAKIFSDKIKGVEARVRATGGGLENAVLTSTGRVDISEINANLAVWALNGEVVYKNKKQPNIALFMGGLAGGLLQVVVQGDSSIKSLADLKGKRVAVGPQGNTTALMMNQLLEIYGIGPSDYTPVYVNYNDGFSALGDGNVDAAIVNSAPPIPGIKELAVRKSIRLLPVSDDKRKAFLEKYPYYRAGILKKSVYDTAEDVATVGTSNIVIVRKDMKADMVYSMVKAVYENLDILRASHPSARAINIKDGPSGGVKLHPGAARYFRERGVLK